VRRRAVVADEAVELPLSLREPYIDDFLSRSDRASVAVAGLTPDVREHIEARWQSACNAWFDAHPISAETRAALLETAPEWQHRDGTFVRRLRPWLPTRAAA
jgi:hypothetical protein